MAFDKIMWVITLSLFSLCVVETHDSHEQTNMQIRVDNGTDEVAEREKTDEHSNIYIIGAQYVFPYWMIRFSGFGCGSGKEKEKFQIAFPNFERNMMGGYEQKILASINSGDFPPIEFIQNILNYLSLGKESSTTCTAIYSPYFNGNNYLWTLTIDDD